jgi:hypothetical protein
MPMKTQKAFGNDSVSRAQVSLWHKDFVKWASNGGR